MTRGSGSVVATGKRIAIPSSMAPSNRYALRATSMYLTWEQAEGPGGLLATANSSSMSLRRPGGDTCNRFSSSCLPSTTRTLAPGASRARHGSGMSARRFIVKLWSTVKPVSGGTSCAEATPVEAVTRRTMSAWTHMLTANEAVQKPDFRPRVSRVNRCGCSPCPFLRFSAAAAALAAF